MGFAWAAARALYLFLPLLVSAAISAVVHRYDLMRQLAKPIDGGAVWMGRRLFGDGKTWRGAYIAVIGSIATVFVQKHAIGARAGTLAIVDYATASSVLLGGAIGGGAILGELPNSFVKRRLGIARGETSARRYLRPLFWLWDQVDLLLGAWLLLAWWVRPTLLLVIASVVLTVVIHPLTAVLGYLLGARSSAR